MMGDINQRMRSRDRFTQGPFFPPSPLDHDLHWNSNPSVNQLCYFDAATNRWLSVNILVSAGNPVNSLPPVSASTVNILRWQVAANFDMWITSLKISTIVAPTNNGSNFWTVSISKTSAGAVDTLLSGGSFTTAADSANIWANHDLALNETVSASGFKVITLKVSATSSPGALNFTPLLLWRSVIQQN